MVEALRMPAGWAEGWWCAFNWTFVGTIVGIGLGAAVLVDMPRRLGKLRGDEHYKFVDWNDWPGEGPAADAAHTEAMAQVSANRRRRVWTRVIAGLTILVCLGGYAAAILAYFTAGTTTKCEDFRGKFDAALAANAVAAVYVLFALAVIGRVLTWRIGRDLPAQKD